MSSRNARVLLPPDSLDQQLARPGRDARCLETCAHDEEARDQDDGRIAESGEHLGSGEDAAEEQRQRHADGDDDRRDLVPDEERQRGEDDREDDGGISHGNLCLMKFWLRFAVLIQCSA